MHLQIFLFFNFIILVTNAQKIIKLSHLKGNNVDNLIDAAPPYSLYVSAHSDDEGLLKQIYVKTDNNEIKDLNSIKNSKVSEESGLLNPFPITSSAHVTTSLNIDALMSLRGFIFITSTKQSKDDSFLVYGVDKPQVINVGQLFNPNATLVFLNSNYLPTTSPYQSSTVSNWLQSDDVTVKMYRGLPTEDEELKSSQIFSNPVQTVNNDWLFIPTVEKFVLSMTPIFYFKTTGDIYFKIEPSWFNLDGYATTGYHSTGFYMKAKEQPPRDIITIFCVRDTRFNGTTGANLVGDFLSDEGTVTITENDGAQSRGSSLKPANQILGWNTPAIGSNLTISSDNSQNGEFFVQFYIIQDQQISSTFAPGNLGTTTIQTTTKRGETIFIDWLTLVLGIFFALMF